MGPRITIIGGGSYQWTPKLLVDFVNTPALRDAEIGHASFYTTPLHLQPALRYLGYSEGDFPETEKASRENLCLPLWAGIREEQQAEVVSVIKRASQIVRS